MDWKPLTEFQGLAVFLSSDDTVSILHLASSSLLVTRFLSERLWKFLAVEVVRPVPECVFSLRPVSSSQSGS